jgi:hypothetical protein
MENSIVLEPSTNTHKLNGLVEVIKTDLPLGGMVLEVNGNGIVTHGEHGVIVTESKNVIKLVQQEFNPVLNILQNSYD